MGGSQGAAAARIFLTNQNNPVWEPYWFGFEPAALVGIAPSSGGLAPLPNDLSVPLIVFAAGDDGDTGTALAVYDETPREQDRLDNAPPRINVRVQPAGHDSFGGVDNNVTSGSVALREYLPRFLQWQIENEAVAENRRVLHFSVYPEWA